MPSSALFEGWPPEAVGTVVAAVIAGVLAAVAAIISAMSTTRSNNRTTAATEKAAQLSAESAKEAARIAADISRREGDRRQGWNEFTWALERALSDDERSAAAGTVVLRSLLSADWMEDRYLEIIVEAMSIIEARPQGR